MNAINIYEYNVLPLSRCSVSLCLVYVVESRTQCTLKCTVIGREGGWLIVCGTKEQWKMIISNGEGRALSNNWIMQRHTTGDFIVSCIVLLFFCRLKRARREREKLNRFHGNENRLLVVNLHMQETSSQSKIFQCSHISKHESMSSVCFKTFIDTTLNDTYYFPCVLCVRIYICDSSRLITGWFWLSI